MQPSLLRPVLSLRPGRRIEAVQFLLEFQRIRLQIAFQDRSDVCFADAPAWVVGVPRPGVPGAGRGVLAPPPGCGSPAPRAGPRQQQRPPGAPAPRPPRPALRPGRGPARAGAPERSGRRRRREEEQEKRPGEEAEAAEAEAEAAVAVAAAGGAGRV